MSRFRFRHRRKSDDTEDWLVTYADAVTLILTFFILLFSVSEPQPSSFKKMSEALSGGFVEGVAEDPMEQMSEELQVLVEESNFEQDMSVEITDKGVTLELSSGSFFHGGSAKFTRKAIPILKQVVGILRDFDFDAYKIQVDGHTDDVPMKSKRFPSNWELSASRASTVVRFFIAAGLKRELMSATGFAEVQPKVPNLDDNGNPIPQNRELNRRVVVRVERVD